jgi:3-hydroxybutyryl-CoA dehydratase
MMTNNFYIGQKASFRKTITDADVLLFSAISGDLNPLHIDSVYASLTKFERRIAHGMLASGLVSAVIGMKLPGPGAVYISQTLNFLKPVYIGDTICAEAEVVEITPKPPRIRLRTLCLNQHHECVLEGEALVKPPNTSQEQRTNDVPTDLFPQE